MVDVEKILRTSPGKLELSGDVTAAAQRRAAEISRQLRENFLDAPADSGIVQEFRRISRIPGKRI